MHDGKFPTLEEYPAVRPWTTRRALRAFPSKSYFWVFVGGSPSHSSASPIAKNLSSSCRFKVTHQLFVFHKGLCTSDYRGTLHAWVGNDLSWRHTRMKVLMTWEDFPRLPGAGVPCVDKQGFLVAHLCLKSTVQRRQTSLPVSSSRCWATIVIFHWESPGICYKISDNSEALAWQRHNCLSGKVKLLFYSPVSQGTLRGGEASFSFLSIWSKQGFNSPRKNHLVSFISLQLLRYLYIHEQ